jgi:hypothetical protein
MSVEFELNPPIVIDRRRKKKKKKTPGLKEGLVMEHHLSQAMQRTVNAADRGMKAYRKARKKSARKGDREVMIDLIPNTIIGTVKTMQGLTLVPVDLLRAVYDRRMMRRMLKFSGRLFEETLRP